VKSKRRGELRDATESLIISLKVKISQVEDELADLNQEKKLLEKRLLEEEKD